MLKATLESIQQSGTNSFLVRRFDHSAFTAPYHFHPELELTWICRGEGTRYVGHHVAPFQSGELLLLGSNLPHCWKLKSNNKRKNNAHTLVIQFAPECLGEDFFNRPEMRAIQKLLAKSIRGIRFSGGAITQATALMEELEAGTDPFQKLMLFLQLLQFLARTKSYQLLNEAHVRPVQTSGEHHRIYDVMAYIVENFRGSISLNQAAAVAGITPTAFCKYFKSVTRKTFVEVVQEYRVNYAAQLLAGTDHPVSHISYESGFGDVSHFYKTFRLRKQLSPLHYRKKFSIAP